MAERMDKTDYYLDIAHAVAQRGTCIYRNFGAVIVKNGEIISTGYTGAPRGRKNCCDIGTCIRHDLHVARGERYELCRSVHAEANAIISAARRDMIGATMYLVGIERPTGEYTEHACSCSMCERMIINAGIYNVIVRDPSAPNGCVVYDVNEWIEHDESLTGESSYSQKHPNKSK